MLDFGVMVRVKVRVRVRVNFRVRVRVKLRVKVRVKVRDRVMVRVKVSVRVKVVHGLLIAIRYLVARPHPSLSGHQQILPQSLWRIVSDQWLNYEIIKVVKVECFGGREV